MKPKSGITLIALVITIVLLIILASVAINLTLGNDGIFNRARTAKEQYQNAQDYEQTQIAKYSNEIDSWTRAGNSNYSETLIWNTPKDSGTITLLNNHTFTEFDQIIVMAGGYEGSGTITNLRSQVIPKSYIKEMLSNSKLIIEIDGASEPYINFSLSNDNELSIIAKSGMSIFKIYGIKF